VAVGSFTVDDARPLDQLGPEDVLPPVEALRGRPRVVVSDGAVAAAVAHGAVLDRATLGVEDEGKDEGQGDGPWAVLDPNGTLLAVYEPHRDGRAKPAVVLA
jgi:hypothetical protein